MNEPQEKMFGDQPLQSKASFRGTPIAKPSPQIVGTVIGTVVAFGLGRGVYKAIAETMEWGTFVTICVGTLILCVGGGVVGGLSQMVIDFVGNEVKA